MINNNNFISISANILLAEINKPIYYTPVNIVEFIRKDLIIANPKYNGKV